MNRTEKKAKTAAQKATAKATRYKRNGGTSRYARKKTWRDSRGLGPLPVHFGTATWEKAQQLYVAFVEAS